MRYIIEQAARVLSTLTTCDGEPNATELHRRQALALADAGLLRRPNPEPDWLDAPAVLAECLNCKQDGVAQTVHVNYSEIAWTCTDCDNPINPEDMENVTPLYPKGK